MLTLAIAASLPADIENPVGDHAKMFVLTLLGISDAWAGNNDCSNPDANGDCGTPTTGVEASGTVLNCTNNNPDPRCKNPKKLDNPGGSSGSDSTASSGGSSGTGSSDSAASSGSSGGNNTNSSSGGSDSAASSGGSSGTGGSDSTTSSGSGATLTTMSFCASGHSNGPGRQVKIMRNGRVFVTKVRCK
jgi:hypothetical protein